MSEGAPDGAQCTIAAPCEFEPGPGLHTGALTRLRCLPAEPDHGVQFIRVDLTGGPVVPARVDFIDADALVRRTTLVSGAGARVNTVEHLLAACHALGIDNMRVEVDGEELPFYDGSAALFAERLSGIGLRAQNRPRDPLIVTRPFVFGEDMAEIVALPDSGLRLTYFADFSGTAIGTQAASYAIGPRTFRDEIAPARTFCLQREIEAMRAAGLIRGAGDHSAVVFGDDGPINTALHFDNEPARHKLLDFLGDLYLLGRPLRGHFMASRSGHRLHAAFVQALRKEFAP